MANGPPYAVHRSWAVALDCWTDGITRGQWLAAVSPGFHSQLAIENATFIRDLPIKVRIFHSQVSLPTDQNYGKSPFFLEVKSSINGRGQVQ